MIELTETLYKRSKNGKIQQWSIEVENGSFRTLEGFVDGAITPSLWTVCKGKSIGKKNETTPAEQAIKEALAKIKKQKEKGYTSNIADVDLAKVKISPMLAFKFEDYREKIVFSAQKIACQPKLDGIRCVGTKDGLFTRNGKPIVAAPHIEQAVKDILSKCPEGSQLDGELYNHSLKHDFNKITSLVKKLKPTEEEIAESEKLLEYHVYDIDTQTERLRFEDRFTFVSAIINDSSQYSFIKTVKTRFIEGALSAGEKQSILDEEYGVYLEEGFEGQMIRKSDSVYENNRSKSLLKRKEFQDEEFELIDIEEGIGNRQGMAGALVFAMPNGTRFNSGMRGDLEFRRKLLADKDSYIGVKFTVRYQNLTPGDNPVPRFPIAIQIRDYE
jgi:DNA ligase-1